MGAAAAGFSFTSCAAHKGALRHWLEDFSDMDIAGLPVRRAGEAGRPGVVLLHEITGLTADCLALAHQIAGEGFQVFVPLLFGPRTQDSLLKGYFQSCRGGLFECSALSTRSKVLDRLEPLCDAVARHTNGPIGVIGMCLTGAFPLALLPNRVDAAVLCQPTVPFSFIPPRPTGRQKADLGVSASELAEAGQSTVPILVIHYASDKRCPPERIDALRSTFGGRIAVASLEGKGKHSTLAGDFDSGAFEDAMTYLKVRMGTAPGPLAMRLAKLGPRGAETACEIGSDRVWHSTVAKG